MENCVLNVQRRSRAERKQHFPARLCGWPRAVPTLARSTFLMTSTHNAPRCLQLSQVLHSDGAQRRLLFK